MDTKTENPKSLLSAIRYFSDPDVCHAYMVNIKWPDGRIACPKCGGENIGEIKSRRMFQCKSAGCRKQFSTKVDTVFEDSPLPLEKWFVAVWMMANCKNGASSHELARAIGVTQKSAWHMLHRVRLAMKSNSFRKLQGEVEVDETGMGGKVRNMHHGRRKGKGTGFSAKTLVQGALERGGEVKCSMIPDQSQVTLHRGVRSKVEAGSTLFTDGLRSYRGLETDYVHEVITHAQAYVEGQVHTNGLDNFWSLLKRTIKGTYVAVDPCHLGSYLDEQVFRFNKRKGNDATRFLEVMLSVVGKRLTYAELTS